MDVFLNRVGSDGIHSKSMTEERWKQMAEKVSEWADAALAEAESIALDGVKIADEGEEKKEEQEKMKAARKQISLVVERSRKVHGILYGSLPEELRTQVAHLSSGWAYGLWHWLETKFQSTEEDNVGELLSQWTQLRMTEDESFDAYRARVNKIQSLLALAKEKQSSKMYAFMLLDRLQPRFKQAVLALKAGGQLKDASQVDWESVSKFINAQEREEQRLVADPTMQE